MAKFEIQTPIAFSRQKNLNKYFTPKQGETSINRLYKNIMNLNAGETVTQIIEGTPVKREDFSLERLHKILKISSRIQDKGDAYIIATTAAGLKYYYKYKITNSLTTPKQKILTVSRGFYIRTSETEQTYLGQKLTKFHNEILNDKDYNFSTLSKEIISAQEQLNLTNRTVENKTRESDPYNIRVANAYEKHFLTMRRIHATKPFTEDVYGPEIPKTPIAAELEIL